MKEAQSVYSFQRYSLLVYVGYRENGAHSLVVEFVWCSEEDRTYTEHRLSVRRVMAVRFTQNLMHERQVQVLFAVGEAHC